MMRILVATDAFPPVCGGSGWSTYELARGLRERGHEVCIVQAARRVIGGARPRVRRIPRPHHRAAGAGCAVRAELLQERAALGARRSGAARHRRRRAGGHPARAARPDVAGGGRRRRGPGPARRLHRARLLARVLLGHAHPRSRLAHAVPGVLGLDDDAVRAASRRRGLAARAPLHPLHAGQPGAQAAGARRGRRRGGRQLRHRARPARALLVAGRMRGSRSSRTRWTWPASGWRPWRRRR